MLMRTFRRWSPLFAHLALLLVLNLVFDGPALAEQTRLRSHLVKLPAELEGRGRPWPDEATIEEALRVLEGLRPLTPVTSPIASLPLGEGGQQSDAPAEALVGAPEGAQAYSLGFQPQVGESQKPPSPEGAAAFSEVVFEKSPLGAGAPLPGEESAMGEGMGVRGPVLLASTVPPPPSLPDMPAASTAPAAPQPMAAPAAAPSPDAISLLSGWNLISLPKQPDSVDPAAVLASISGSYNVAHAYDACSSDRWRTYDPAAPAESSLTAIDHRIGLWVRATVAAPLAVSGTEPAETSIQLCQGWNLIGYPLSQPRPVLAALSSIAGRFQRVYGWDPADPADPWEVFDVAVPAWANDLERMLPGRGYWIYATEDTTLTLSNAGLPPEVAITSPANAATITAPTDIVGTVRSNLLENWTLAWRLKGEAGAFTTFATGNTPVTNGVLAKFDPTLLLNGLYEIELNATDFQGQSASVFIDVVVEGNLKIGNFTLSFVDLEVPLAGLPIQVIRTYDSRDKRVGDFGVGWTLSVSRVRLQEDGPVGESWQGVTSGGSFPTYCVQPVREHQVTITLPDDKVLRFRPKLTPECQLLAPPQVVNISYVPLPGTVGSLEMLDQNPQALVVGSFPGTVQLWDQDGVELEDPGRYRLTMQDGRAFVIDQAAGLINLTDRNGNTLTFGRNGITHSSGEGVVFERDVQGKITRIADPAGESLTYSYDTAVDLVAVTDRGEATTHFTYDDHFLLSIQDSLGRQPIRNEYDALGRLISTTDAFGKKIELTHSLAENREVITDRLGHSRVFEFDARGNIIRETDALGKVTTRSFDARDNLLAETNPLGETTSYSYDASDNVTSIADPLGHVTHYTYDSRAQVLTAVDPLDGVTTNTYDVKGNLLTTTDAAGGVTTYTYDANGNPTSVTDPSGARTLYAYDSAGHVTRITDALGHATTYTYDQRGNRLTETTQRTTASGTETLVTTRTYDPQGHELSVTDAAGGVSSNSYDTLGQVTSRTDALGRTTRLAYDNAGRPTTTTYSDGTTETRSYDAEGHLISQTDRAGRVTTYTYDAAGRQLSTTFLGTIRRNSYDAAGRVVASTDARGNVTRYEYDAAGRRIKVIDPLGHEMRYFYDAAGNQVAFLDARDHTTQLDYDALGRLTRTVYPDGTEARQAYDEVGRRISSIDQAGRTTRFSYDDNSRLVSVTDALSQVTAYAYDEVGNRTSQTDANGHTTRFGFDRLGRQTRRELPDGSVETRVFDAVGNLLTHNDFSGATKTYAYDSMNRLLTKNLPGGSVVTFTYQSTGQRATQTDARGTTTYQYDVQDRLESLVYPDGRALTYRYDDEGNRTEHVALLAGGVTLSSRFSYDALNRLATVTDPLGRVYTHDYDAVGNRAEVSYPNGVATRYSYNALNRLTQLTALAAGGGVVASYAYTLGPSGNRTRIDEAGGLSRSYTYDALYRLVGEEVTGSTGLFYRNGFTYDPVGNRLTQAKTGSTGGTTTLTYGYDNRDRLLTETGTSYTWDANGNLRSKSGTDGATYTWDSENRLTEVSRANGDVVKHAYDADGNRVRTEITPAIGPPVVTDYLVDPFAELSQVIAETDAAGAWSQYFVRGDDLLAVLRPTQTRFYHSDGLGSIRALTDETGTVTDTYTFSAFGELLAHTGTDPNAYLFAGEPLDPNSGFYYLRARWMDPRVGRFGSEDSWPGHLFEPESLHRYVYVGNDPTNKIDPSGRSEFSLSGLLISAAIGGIISAITGINAQSTLASVGKDFLLGALEGALLYGAGVAVFKAFVRLGNLAVQSYRGAQAARIARAIERVLSRVVNAGELHPGTSLPKFFTFRSTLGDVFVNPNATKHMVEVLKSTGNAGSTRAATALMLQELDAAITRAAIEGFRYGSPIRVGAWELIFVIEKKVGTELVPLVLKHAIFFF